MAMAAQRIGAIFNTLIIVTHAFWRMRRRHIQGAKGHNNDFGGVCHAQTNYCRGVGTATIGG
ncbi:hypothetical protein [Magnetospirillum gryphiswaldense]|uniref:Uncharacterized protein n=1 Tax=Magnetospirillum gryphiswaldense TaxID=55518 RepID=A4U3I2_9PROT|nr:hypothetical protein [Magnetospirillum gryphiswaldense]CAM77439.1 hypothetical protein MGR_2019 [Magnetospirillum gryphiswaldense MSR-1]